MTEPEDLEEDLFADLYDADDTTNHVTAPSAVPKPFEPAPPVALPQIYEIPAPQPIENMQASQVSNGGQVIPGGGLHQNGIGMIDQGRAKDVTTSFDTEPEPQGTGIKEDG
ncbi:hypothetical protein V8E54_007326 [Elaphomyces granulatus]|jgi:RNA-binding protein Musashi